MIDRTKNIIHSKCELPKMLRCGHVLRNSFFTSHVVTKDRGTCTNKLWYSTCQLVVIQWASGYSIMSASGLCQLAVVVICIINYPFASTTVAFCMILNNVYKDKCLSSARKRMMSQLGKRKGRARNISEEKSTQDQQETVSGESQTTLLDTTFQTPSTEKISSSGDETQHAT